VKNDRKRLRAERAIAERAMVAHEREREFPDVWKQAKRLALAAGSLTVTEKFWRLAYREVVGKAVPR
jgi:hypothetical protein